MTTCLITNIQDHTEISEGLYPGGSTGKTTRKNKGVPKTDHQYKLAQLTLGTHPDYCEAFARAVKPRDKSRWTMKIKNRLVWLDKQTRLYRDILGDTGEGIKHAGDIDMSLDNNLTSKWGMHSP